MTIGLMQGLLRTCVSLLAGTLIATRISLIALIRQFLLLLGELLCPSGLLHRIHLEWQQSTNLPGDIADVAASP